VLRESRRKDSRDKRARVLHTLNGLLTRGEPVTFTAVAKAAGVSNWLVYAPGVREHIEAARTQQARTATRGDETRSAGGAVSTRTDLEVLRADNLRLRGQVGDLKDALQRQLGRQLEQLQATDLTKRIGELTAQNQELNSQLTQLQHEKQELERRLVESNDDLVAARASLRRMIRTENTY
jgi:chromosome segregation ATPase